MRIKPSDGPLAIHNVNVAHQNDILNSPKRINTLQNSNHITTTAQYDNSTSLLSNQHRTSDGTQIVGGLDNNVDRRWCGALLTSQKRNNVNEQNNRNQLRNLNSGTLAASLRTAPIINGVSNSCSDSSPDDSLLDYDNPNHRGSSLDASPQYEDASEPESLSEDTNLNNRKTIQTRGIVNPNYPGFQRFAHTLNYTIRVASDTDEDYECDALVSPNLQTDAKETTESTADLNNLNNNNLEETIDYVNDKIDSVNRLNSFENIQKVFYDKPVLDLTDDNRNVDGSNNLKAEPPAPKIELKLNIEAAETEVAKTSVVGDFGREVEDELDRVAAKNATIDDDLFVVNFEPSWERAVVREIEEAIEKLTELLDLEPTATTYCIEPNTEEPFNKITCLEQDNPVVLEDSRTIVVQDTESATGKDSIKKNTENKMDVVALPASSESTKKSDWKTCKMDVDINELKRDSNRQLEEIEIQIKKIKSDTVLSKKNAEEIEKFCPEVAIRKRKDYAQQIGSLIQFPRRGNHNETTKRCAPIGRDRKKTNEAIGGFDVYNIETAMPNIDLEIIEQHLQTSREEERRRRTDREEIRRRLAMGTEDEYYTDRPGRKPSLQSRLQSGMNLQICFMNEALSDTDSPSSDSESPLSNLKQHKTSNNFEEKRSGPPCRPSTLSIGDPSLHPPKEPPTDTDFFTKQARLQTEARMALAQAKEMARMQMEIEKQKQKKSPITEMVRHSLEKVGIPFPEGKRRLSRQILTEMNVAQLQVIVNDLHTQIETLNEQLVKYLMNRDDLHMEQDSMLVDIEDLTRYLGDKEQIMKEQSANCLSNNNASPPSPAPSSPLLSLNNTVKPHLNRIANLVKK